MTSATPFLSELPQLPSFFAQDLGLLQAFTTLENHPFFEGEIHGKIHGHSMFEPGEKNQMFGQLLPAHIHIHITIPSYTNHSGHLGTLDCRFQKMLIRSRILFLSNTKQWSTPMAKRMGPGPSCERLDWTWISKHWLRSMGISGS